MLVPVDFIKQMVYNKLWVKYKLGVVIWKIII
jgi:hypothetical protein